jgi:hypothetical protein
MEQAKRRVFFQKSAQSLLSTGCRAGALYHKKLPLSIRRIADLARSNIKTSRKNKLLTSNLT